MAYIDPKGMFGGDRMALLSDSAKMAWPWFWCASNTCGRVELSYRAFCDGPFRQFHKPPTEKQFWEWVAEFHECYLMFVYQVDGKAWGQWDVSERYLPTYKTKADERTPSPMTRPWLSWREQYQSAKSDNLTSKCRIFRVSENFSEILKSSEEFPLGRGIGVGSGEDKNSAAEAAGLFDEAPPDQPTVVRPHLPSQKPKGKRSTEEIRKALGPRLSWWEQFWDVYPCHQGMNPAMDAFERTVSTLELFGAVLSGAKAYAERYRKNPDMRLKYGQGWIHDERWTDEGIRAPPAPEPRLNEYKPTYLAQVEAIERREQEEAKGKNA